ncbi:MAG: hypothetical protein J6N95_02225 [Bacilli bacterium]|nr:hypothetical protein [Bacilli bacterium]
MNDIEKKLRKRGMAKLDKFAKNPYKVKKKSWFERIPLWPKVVIPTAVLTTALFAVVVSSFSIDMFSPKGRQTDTSQSPVASSNPGSAQGSKSPATSSYAPAQPSQVTPGEKGETGWKGLPVYKKFPAFTYQGVNYETVNGDNYVSEQSINYKLDVIVLTAKDDIGVDRSIDAGIFTLMYAPYEELVALRFTNDNYYYLYGRQ